MKKLVLLMTVIAISILVGWMYTMSKKTEMVKAISSFEECKEGGYPIQESYPARCSTPDGKTFAEDIGNEMEYKDSIVVDNPRPNVQVTSPLRISGKARGTWFFEASFSAELFDDTNTSLGVTVVQAEGEWMTEEFVPFTATMTFKKPVSKKGKLLIKNANPSGLPENDKQLIIPVTF